MQRIASFVGVALCLSACATAPPRHPSAAIPRPPLPSADPRIEISDFRTALEDSRDRIDARRAAPLDAPLVDADAIFSMPIPEHRTIAGAIRYFSTDLKDKIQLSLTRSARFKLMIDKVLEEHRLPKALAYLPVIESAYLPSLTSRAGARGVWQLMPDTARELGLRVDWWVDERTSPEKSTRAAAKFIRQLYAQFGDWPLVLAAYNAGPGRVRRALEETGASTFWELLEISALPKETRGYVPTFFATIAIVGDPSSYGFELSRPEKIDYDRVELEGPVSLDYVAEVSGVDPAVLRAENPELRHGVVPPEGYRIKLPKGRGELVQARAADLRFEDPHVAVASFTLRAGDSLTRLAKLIEEKPSEILEMNGLPANTKLSAGDSLYLPVRQAELSTLLAESRSPVGRSHRVLAGETLYSIAREYGLTLAELLDLNGLEKSAIIHPGDRLRVSAGTAVMTGGGM